MLYFICPGFHDPYLTDSFVKNISNHSINLDNFLIFPTDQYPPYSSFHSLQYLQQKCQQKAQKLIIIAFSAGVVAAVTTAQQWQRQGGNIQGLIAFDGWGVPLWGNFPIYRISHDSFTHHSSSILGAGKLNFYADPAVDHLHLWRSPDLVQGWMVQKTSPSQTLLSKNTLIDFLRIVMASK